MHGPRGLKSTNPFAVMKPEDQLIDALLREQARQREGDEDLLSAIDRALKDDGDRRQPASKWRRLLPLSIAAGLAIGAVVIHQQRDDGAPELAIGPDSPLAERTTTGVPAEPAPQAVEAPVAAAARGSAPMRAMEVAEGDPAMAPRAARMERQAMPMPAVETPEEIPAALAADSAALGEADAMPADGEIAVARVEVEISRRAQARSMPLRREPAAGLPDEALADPAPGDPGDLGATQIPRVFSRDHGRRLIDQPWKSPWQEAVSNVPVEVDTAAYATLLRLLRNGQPVPPDEVRIEQLIHAFDYGYPPPSGDEAFAVSSLLATSPWHPERLLARLAIKGRDGDGGVGRDFQAKLVGPAEVIAREVKLQVEFNPGKVKAYRLIGHARRAPRQPPVDYGEGAAGGIVAGHTLTALFEIIPVGAEGPELGGVDELKYQRPADRPELVESDEWFTLKLRSKPAGDARSRLIEVPVTGEPLAWREAGGDFRMAAAVALAGMKWRGRDEVAGIGWERLQEIAGPALDDDPDGRRAEFFELIKDQP